MATKTISDVRKELKKHVDIPYRDGAIRFYKEPIKCWGVRSPHVKTIGSEAYAKIKHLSKQEVFDLAEELIKSNMNEEAIIGFDWIYRRKKEFTESDFKFFDKIVKNYLTNWALVDTFCTHAMSELLSRYPSLIPKVRAYVKSRNRWVKRAAAVSFIGPIQKARDVRKDVFWVADKLMMNQDDLVQKGYGWMLKTTAEHNQKEVFDFVMKYKDRMPRTALRYAIEKMPQKKKKQAMS